MENTLVNLLLLCGLGNFLHVYLWKGFPISLRTDRRFFKTYGAVSSTIWRTLICRAWLKDLSRHNSTLCTTLFLLLSGLYDNAPFDGLLMWCPQGGSTRTAMFVCLFLFCFGFFLSVLLGQLYGLSVSRMEIRPVGVWLCTSVPSYTFLYG